MDDAHCPHCGDKIPIVRDAFCGTCGEDMDEPPMKPRTEEEKLAYREKVQTETKGAFFRLLRLFGKVDN